MCGLCGVISRALVTRDKEMFTHLLYVSAFRGFHSTGITRVATSENDKVKKRKVLYGLHKTVDASPDCVRTKEYSEFLERPQIKALLGHCRHATKGEITLNNCHPFEVGGIVGQHNGTIHGNSLLDQKDFETDSEALFHTIDKEGVEGLIDRVKHSGSFALAWFDKNDCTVSLLRNSGRPLYITEPQSEYGEIYYASESEFLEMVLNRKNASYKSIYSLPIYKELRFNLRPGVNPLEDFKEIRHNAPVYTYYQNNHKKNWGDANKNRVWDYQAGCFIDEDKPKTNLVKLTDIVRGKKKEEGQYELKGQNHIVSKGRLEEMLVEGCAYCTYTPEVEEFDELTFVNKTQFLCGKCDGTRYANKSVVLI